MGRGHFLGGIANWRGWRFIWRGLNILILIGVVGIGYNIYESRQRAGQRYDMLLKGAYTEALLNKIDAENALGHFQSGSGTLLRFSVQSAEQLLRDEIAPNKLRLGLELYIRDSRSKNLALDAANEFYRTKCFLTPEQLTQTTDTLEAFKKRSLEMLDLLAQSLKDRDVELPATQGPTEGQVTQICIGRD